jgi:5'-nucleotidase
MYHYTTFNHDNSRRNFIQKAFGATAAIGLSGISTNALASKEIVKITVLSTNDVHSHIDPFPENDPKFAGLGGAARRAKIIENIRKDEKNVLLLDAGDVFQGTPYFNKYGGELELKLMSMMGYDATTIGNHDFDNGLEGLLKVMPNANFPYLNTCYNFDDTILKGKTIPYKIFVKDGIKIGVFGIGIELDGLVDKRMYGATKYNNAMEQAAIYTHKLKHDLKCDLVICLSHLGYKYEEKKISDMDLAKHSKDIDLIIGGHTHTFLEKPLEIRNRDGKACLVSQVGWAGLRLGRVDFYFEKNSKHRVNESANIKVLDYTIG